jgi:hypothetical protein
MTNPNSSPWGPHTPPVPPHTVTPNPTAPSTPYIPGQTPTPSDPYALGVPGLDGDWRPSGTARPKSVPMGLILTFCFGPSACTTQCGAAGPRQFPASYGVARRS